MKTPLAWDIETTGTPFDGRIVTVAWQKLGESAHVARWEDAPELLFEMLVDQMRPKISHTKYDPRFVRLCYGNELVRGSIYDTQVMARLLNENQSLALDALVLRYCKYKMDKRIRRSEGKVLFECDDGSLVPLDEAPIDQLYAYNMRDVEAETELFETLYERLLDGEWLGIFLQEEVPYTEVLLDMECRGFPVDLKRTAIFAEEMEKEHVWLDGELHETGSLPVAFNLNSPDQLAAYLFAPKVFELVADLDVGTDVCECVKSCLAGEHEDCEGIPELPSDEFAHVVDLLPEGFHIDKVGRAQIHGRYTLRSRGLKPGVRTESGKLSVSRPALKGNFSTASDSWCQRLLEYKQIDKLLTTYLRKFPKVAVEVGASRPDESLPELTGTPISTRIFGKFNQTGTKTGRLSSSEPNLQNIPTRGDLGSRVRDLFRTVT